MSVLIGVPQRVPLFLFVIKCIEGVFYMEDLSRCEDDKIKAKDIGLEARRLFGDEAKR
jgi:hypothetical protein